jgi:hypothetical protein
MITVFSMGELGVWSRLMAWHIVYSSFMFANKREFRDKTKQNFVLGQLLHCL